jgi:hypothetical protein
MTSILFWRLDPVTPDTDAFGVDARLAAQTQHFFVAGTFAFGH